MSDGISIFSLLIVAYEIASSAFGPPRNDATMLIIYDVAYGASAPSAIIYVLLAFIKAAINFQEMFNESCKKSIVNGKKFRN